MISYTHWRYYGTNKKAVAKAAYLTVCHMGMKESFEDIEAKTIPDCGWPWTTDDGVHYRPLLTIEFGQKLYGINVIKANI